MKKFDNYESVEANEGGEYKRLPAGGYVCRIENVLDHNDKEYLEIEYDIMDGEFCGWFGSLFSRAGFWGGKLIRSYKDTAQKFFKGFITAVEQSNQGSRWDWNENHLKDRLVGLVLAEEEYNKNDGSVGVRLYVARNTSVENIRKGNYEVPTIRKLKYEMAPAAPKSDKPDEDLPF